MSRVTVKRRQDKARLTRVGLETRRDFLKAFFGEIPTGENFRKFLQAEFELKSLK